MATWQGLYRNQLREYRHELKIAWLKGYWPDAKRMYGTHVALPMFILSVVSIQWIRFLSFCARGGSSS